MSGQAQALDGARPLWGEEVGCAHGVARGKRCRRCFAEEREVRELVAEALAARKEEPCRGG